MSPYEENILDFYKIYEEQPELFTDDDRASFEALKATFAEDDSIEKISDTIALWCEEHPNILNALLELPPSETSERGAGGRSTRLNPKEVLGLLDNITRSGPAGRPTRLDPEETSELLDNIVRESETDSGSSSSPPQK
ncbi:hypothetical protein XM38_023680 [Halomicronema hongdechloris C2206]|uniref:Uncharacterized protein n=1 Tax=Halomicronema hongdechloris C2206 TaxID=1641165 RepID=A0A1Z3HME1_9CYAN|nr:hypothetical protein [Halomicronema hongdechloris]ASC71416.1 hypothetical protein XM38_023680 [Halomicronema hongdechloris C2206]